MRPYNESWINQEKATHRHVPTWSQDVDPFVWSRVRRRR